LPVKIAQMNARLSSSSLHPWLVRAIAGRRREESQLRDDLADRLLMECRGSNCAHRLYVASLQMQLCLRARRACGSGTSDISWNAMTADALVAPWSANMLDEKRIARVVGLALGSVFLASLCLNALTW